MKVGQFILRLNEGKGLTSKANKFYTVVGCYFYARFGGFFYIPSTKEG